MRAHASSALCFASPGSTAAGRRAVRARLLTPTAFLAYLTISIACAVVVTTREYRQASARVLSGATPHLYTPRRAGYMVEHLGYSEDDVEEEMLRLYKDHGTTLAGLVVRRSHSHRLCESQHSLAHQMPCDTRRCSRSRGDGRT